jgi:NAD(P)-dependent dehydrogenase (short-subunit alcohol dehydrogenase family)
MQISGNHIMVTGGASGLGEATARSLAESGARITIVDRSADAVERIASDIGARALVADVADPELASELEKAAEDHGPIRGLVNCAGIGTAARIAGRDGPMPLEAFETVIRVNLIGTFNMLRLAASHMTRQEPMACDERGAIVNTASVAAFDGQVGQAAYAASKGGIVALALPAARELSRFGIRVNTVAPGIFLTPLLQELPEEARTSIAAAVPFPARLGDPAEFADAVRFCLENTYLNAEVIRLDGGMRLPPK